MLDKTSIATLFPEKVVTEETNPLLIEGSLYPEEEAFIYNAVTKRKLEFTAGRLCARKSLIKFGIMNHPLLMAKDRTTVWPSDIVGSISHTTGYCGVALAQKSEIKSIGFDVEGIGKLGKDCWKLVLTPSELTRINSMPADEQAKYFALVFSAKECLYKCQYPISKQRINFLDVEIYFNRNTGEFEVVFVVDVRGFFTKGASFKGKYFFRGGYIFTGMTFCSITQVEKSLTKRRWLL